MTWVATNGAYMSKCASEACALACLEVITGMKIGEIHGQGPRPGLDSATKMPHE